MSLFFRRADERAITSVPWSHGGPRLGGSSMKTALALVPVYASVRLISDSICTLPLQQFRRTPEGRSPMPLSRVLDAPSAYGTRVEWVQAALVSALLEGNAFGLKAGYDAETLGASTVTWLDPTKVDDPCDGSGDWLYAGRRIAGDRMLHIPALVLPGQRKGVSPMAAARSTVDTGLEAQAFARDWFRNRAVPGLVFKNGEKTIAPETADTAKQRLMATLRSGEPFVTGKDWTLDVMKMPAADAGFVTSSKLTATQIASIYGVPPEMIGGETGSSLTYSTVELNQIAFLTNTLRPWITRMEAALSSLLPKPQFVKFNVDALLRVDTKTRHEVYKLDREMGLKNIDEIRVLEDEQPLPDGKGQDYTPLAKVGTTPAQEAR